MNLLTSKPLEEKNTVYVPAHPMPHPVPPLHPTHSTHYETEVQPIEFMQANMSKEAFNGFLIGNIIKYSGRLGKKDEPLKEADKIYRYAGWLVQALKGEKIDPRV